MKWQFDNRTYKEKLQEEMFWFLLAIFPYMFDEHANWSGLGRLPSTSRGMNFNSFPTQVDCDQSFVSPTLARETRYQGKNCLTSPSRTHLSWGNGQTYMEKFDFQILGALKDWIFNFFFNLVDYWWNFKHFLCKNFFFLKNCLISSSILLLLSINFQ